MTMEEHTRRRFLTALGVSGAAAALVPGVAAAAPAPPDGGGGDIVIGRLPGVPELTEGAPGARHEAFPAPTPGLKYTLLSGGQFMPLSNTFAYSKSPLLLSSGGFSFGVPLDMLPNGAVIAEVVFSVGKSLLYSGNMSASLSRFAPYDPALVTSAIATANTGALATSNAVQYISLPLTGAVGPRTVDQSAAKHWLFAILDNNALFEVRIGWIPPAAPLGFYLLPPKRVYDSRRPTGGGLLAAGGTRVVSVKDGYVNDTDTLDAPNIVPVGAKGIAYNLTIVGTTGAGYLSVGPGDATAAAGSAINWGGPDQVLANGLTVSLDASRQIKVFAGPGGGTQFLIDVNGYYV